MSWSGFRINLRPIMLLAVGCVLFTATAVAATMHWLLGMPWAVGFLVARRRCVAAGCSRTNGHCQAAVSAATHSDHS